MERPCELKLLFATQYSDACFRSIRAVAQLADALRVSVTIAHVGPVEPAAKRELDSFYAEADHYESCRRVQLQGSSVARVLSDHAREGGYDLIVAPCSDRLGLPRPFHRSIRAELLRSGRVPVWTMGRELDRAAFRREIRTVAVGLDGVERDLTHLKLATAFADRVGAALLLLTVVPTVHEGTLVAQALESEPLSRDTAIERIRRLLRDWPIIPEIEVAVGSSCRELPRMVQRREADVLFLTETQSRGGIFLPAITRTVDHSPCPVIITPAQLPPEFGWEFHKPTVSERLALPAPQRIALPEAASMAS